MALKLATKLSRQAPALARQMSSHGLVYTEDKSIIGSREVIGYGINGRNVYFDREDCPMPGIRFREEDSTIKAIREKEKGDWKKLTLEEKKALYRYSFCQTFAEMQAPTAEGKIILGWTLIGLALGYGAFVLFGEMMPKNPALAVYDEYDTKVAALQKKLDMGTHRTRSYAAEWDIEKRDWKK